ncbi:hypothetical protein [Kitasatospora sp. NPDC088346]|uniref:hypothetical protein n=1 Tax=Kitasatospora sp. NPDC088346 TaxID=3364073 RepID=UPI00380B8BFB
MPSGFDTTLLAATADRRRCTGESHQALAALHRAGADVRTVPAPADPEQADLEAAVFLRVCRIGIRSADPLGIRSVHPEPHRLAVRLTPQPYVVRLWAEALLSARRPDHPGPHADPRDHVVGIPGLRWHTIGHAVHLHRPRTNTLLSLGGFPTRWWPRAAAAVHRWRPEAYTGAHWHAAEQAARAAQRTSALHPTTLLSPLLRRVRATAGPGPVNATDAWDAIGGLRLEALDGPPCPDLVRLLGDGPCGVGWQARIDWCGCPGGTVGSNCSVDFRDPGDGRVVYYSNRRVRRSAQDLQALADNNEGAFTA